MLGLFKKQILLSLKPYGQNVKKTPKEQADAYKTVMKIRNIYCKTNIQNVSQYFYQSIFTHNSIKNWGKRENKTQKSRKLTWERFCISILFLYSRKMNPMRLRNKVKLQLYYVGVQWIRNIRYYTISKNRKFSNFDIATYQLSSPTYP